LSTTNEKHESKPAIGLNNDEHELNKATKNEDCDSKGDGTTESVWFFLAFSVELGIKAKTNYKAQDNTSWATWNLVPLDERLVPDLLRGRDRSVGGDLDVGEDDYEQMIVILQSLHYDFVGYQHVHTQVGLTKKAKFL
jgi:hypothetical protein